MELVSNFLLFGLFIVSCVFSFSLSLGDGSIKTEMLPERAITPPTSSDYLYQHPSNPGSLGIRQDVLNDKSGVFVPSVGKCHNKDFILH